MQSATSCPACSSTSSRAHDLSGVRVCAACSCIFTERAILRGDSFTIVLPSWDEAGIPIEDERPFDLTVVGSAGVERRHGWFNPATRRITQTG